MVNLILYYDIDKKNDTITHKKSDILHLTRTFKLCTDKELTQIAGTCVCENVYCFKEDVCQMNNSVYLPEISSGFSSLNISSIKNHENYMLKSSQEFEFDIYAGSGDFLNARGKMVITTDNTPVRKVSIYLQNKTDSKRKLRKTNKTRKNQ